MIAHHDRVYRPLHYLTINNRVQVINSVGLFRDILYIFLKHEAYVIWNWVVMKRPDETTKILPKIYYYCSKYAFVMVKFDEIIRRRWMDRSWRILSSCTVNWLNDSDPAKYNSFLFLQLNAFFVAELVSLLFNTLACKKRAITKNFVIRFNLLNFFLWI